MILRCGRGNGRFKSISHSYLKKSLGEGNLVLPKKMERVPLFSKESHFDVNIC